MARIGVIDDCDEVDVQTWCRICGDPLLLVLPYDYEAAVEWCYEADDEIFEHGNHSESGGWGYHLRFDDILLFLFGEKHFELGPFWPKPTWYNHSENEDMAVNFVSSRLEPTNV